MGNRLVSHFSYNKLFYSQGVKLGKHISVGNWYLSKCRGITKGNWMTNHLGMETNLYLLQHAGNPVDWYPWGDEALIRARTEDKPILLSIGYSLFK
jgi:hypothetical protein